MWHSVEHVFRIRESNSERTNDLSQLRLVSPVPGRGAIPCSAIDSVKVRVHALSSTRVQPHVPKPRSIA
jgi:hypothetical protein